MKQFPKQFIWGSATSSFQIEGAWLEGGKGLSIWDVFGHTPGKVANNDTGDVACDHYHRWKEDVELMAAMKLPAYRFSIAWPRIQPTGYGPPNPEGIAFYSNLIDALLDKGITPWVTLYHWDLPTALEFEHGGWLNPKLAEFFRDYADICFEHFGDRVKHWMTINEPCVIAVHGYTEGYFPPGRTSQVEPYIAGHHLLRAHAYAVDLYRRKYQAKQKGRIGMVCNCDWREPATDTEQDREAGQQSGGILPAAGSGSALSRRLPGQHAFPRCRSAAEVQRRRRCPAEGLSRLFRPQSLLDAARPRCTVQRLAVPVTCPTVPQRPGPRLDGRSFLAEDRHGLDDRAVGHSQIAALG